MPSQSDLNAVFAKSEAGESFYWNVCDGGCSGTELVWLPSAKRWIYRDNDGYTVGECDSLTLVLSEEDGDESGMHCVPGLLAVELGDNRGLWVIDGSLPEDWELPEDAEVFTVCDPADGLVSVEVVQS